MLPNNRSHSYPFIASKHTAVLNIKQAFVEINETFNYLVSLKNEEMMKSDHDLSSGDDHRFNDGNRDDRDEQTLTQQLNSRSLKRTVPSSEFAPKKSDSKCCESDRLDLNKISDQPNESVGPNYRDYLIINMVVQRIKVNLHVITGNSIETRKSMFESSRIDQTGHRRPAVFKFRQRIQDNNRSELVCAYIGPELLFMINGFLGLWNTFFEKSMIGDKMKDTEFMKIVESLKILNHKFE